MKQPIFCWQSGQAYNPNPTLPTGLLTKYFYYTIFLSGTLHSNSTELYVVNESKANDKLLAGKQLIAEMDTVKCTIGQLYVFMGRELTPVDTVPAGNIVGIAGTLLYWLTFYL